MHLFLYTFTQDLKKGEEAVEVMEECGDDGGEREKSDGEGMAGERGDNGGEIEVEDRRGGRGGEGVRVGEILMHRVKRVSRIHLQFSVYL